MNDREIAEDFIRYRRDQSAAAIREARRAELARIDAEQRGTTVEAELAAELTGPISSMSPATLRRFDKLHGLDRD